MLADASSLPQRPALGLLLCLPLVLLLAALLMWPLVQLVLQSVDGGPGAPWWRAWSDLVSVPRHRRALLTSVGLSAAVAIVSTAVCLMPAWLLARRLIPGGAWLRMVLALPMSFSGLIVGFLLIVLIGRAGALPALTGLGSGLAYTLTGLLLAYLYFEVPRATLTLESAIRTLDPQLDVAARSLGARPWQHTLFVVLPLLGPALLATIAMTFAVSLGSFGVALLLSVRGIALLPLELFMQYMAPPTDRALAAAMALTLAAIALGVGVGLRRLVEPRYA